MPSICFKIFQQKKRIKGQREKQMKQDQQNADRYTGVHNTLLFWGIFKLFHNKML